MADITEQQRDERDEVETQDLSNQYRSPPTTSLASQAFPANPTTPRTASATPDEMVDPSAESVSHSAMPAMAGSLTSPAANRTKGKGKASESSSAVAVTKKSSGEPGSSNDFALVHNGKIIKGVAQVMGYVMQQPESERAALVEQTNKSMDHLVNGYLGEVAKWVDFQSQEKLSDLEEFKEQYAYTYAAIQSWKAVRDKKTSALTKLESLWGNDPRGKAWVENVFFNNKYSLRGDKCSGYLGTLAKKMNALQATRLLNLGIIERLKRIADPKTERRGLNTSRFLAPADVNWAFNKAKEDGFSVITIAIPREEDVSELGLTPGPLGLYEAIPNDHDGPSTRLVRTFEGEESDPVFYLPRLTEDTGTTQNTPTDQVPPNVSLPPRAASSGPMTSGEPGSLENARPEREQSTESQEPPVIPPNSEEDLATARKGKAAESREETPHPPKLPENVAAYLDKAQLRVSERVRRQLRGTHLVVDLTSDEISGKNLRSKWEMEVAGVAETADLEEVVRFNEKLLGEPGSSEKVIAYQETASKTLNTKDCTCKIEESIKRRIEFGDGLLRLPITKRMEFYPLSRKNVDLGGMCDYHVSAFASYLGLVSTKVTQAVLHERLMMMRKNESRLAAFRLENPDWFRKAQEVENIRKLVTLGASKYRPSKTFETDETKKVKAKADVRCSKGSGRETGYFVIDTPDCGWLKYNEELFGYMEQEFEMYLHHCREVPTDTPGMMLKNMYYSVTQQLVRSDHGLYLAVATTRDDQETKLVSYPDSARYYSQRMDETSTEVDFAFVQADIPDLEGKGSIKSRMSDFVLLHELGSGAVLTIAKAHEKLDLITHAKNNVRLRSLMVKKVGKALENKYTMNVGKWRKLPFDDETIGQVLLVKPGMPVRFRTTDEDEFVRIVSANYVAVKNDGTIETGLQWEELSEWCRNLRVPEVPRWEKTPEVSAAPFKAVASLTGLGALSDALLGRLPWTDRAVLRERDVLMSLSNEELEEHLDKQRGLAIKQAILTFKGVFADEKAIYGAKSWAATKGKHPAKPEPMFLESELAKYEVDIFADVYSTTSGKKSFREPGSRRMNSLSRHKSSKKASDDPASDDEADDQPHDQTTSPRQEDSSRTEPQVGGKQPLLNLSREPSSETNSELSNPPTPDVNDESDNGTQRSHSKGGKTPSAPAKEYKRRLQTDEEEEDGEEQPPAKKAKTTKTRQKPAPKPSRARTPTTPRASRQVPETTRKTRSSGLADQEETT